MALKHGCFQFTVSLLEMFVRFEWAFAENETLNIISPSRALIRATSLHMLRLLVVLSHLMEVFRHSTWQDVFLWKQMSSPPKWQDALQGMHDWMITFWNDAKFITVCNVVNIINRPTYTQKDMGIIYAFRLLQLAINKNVHITAIKQFLFQSAKLRWLI